MSFFSSKLSKDKEEKVVALVSSILEDFQKDFAGFYNVNVAQKPKQDASDLKLPKVAAQVDHLKRGNLFKTGDTNKSWKKRHFVVHNEKGDFKVEYFESEDGVLKGWFNPAGYYADSFTPEEQKSLGTFGIKLVPYMGQRRVWYMRADTEADRVEWMNVFDSACSRAQPQNDADNRITCAYYSALDTIRYKYNERGWYYRYGTEMDKLFDFVELIVYRDLTFLSGTKTNSTVTTQVHKIIQDDVSSVWNKATKEASDRTIALDMCARGSAKQFMEQGVQLKNRTIEILAPTIRPFVAEHGAKTLRPILSNLVAPVAIAFSQGVQFFYTSLTSKYDSGELNTPPKRKTVIKTLIKRCESHWATDSLLYYSAMTIAGIYNNNPQTSLHFPTGSFALTDVKHLVLDRVRDLMYRALENFYTISDECTTSQVTDKIVRATHTYLKDAKVMVKNTLSEIMRNILSIYVMQLWFPGGLTLQPIQTAIDTITVGGLSQLFHVNSLVRDVIQDVIERTIVSGVDTHRDEYDAIINKVQVDVMLPEDPDKSKDVAASQVPIVDDADL